MLLYGLQTNQLQSMGRAFGYACRFQAGIQPIHTEIAFYGIAVIGIFHRNIPGTGFRAGHAANAFFLVNVDDTVISLNHGLGRADRHTERFFAMAASCKNDFGFGNATYHLQRGAADIAEKGADGQLLVGLAMHLTTMAGDASTGVEMNHIFFHRSILLLVLRMLFLTWTKTSHRLTPPPAWSQSSSLPTINF